MPLFDIIIRTLVSAESEGVSTGFKISTYLICAITLSLFAVLMLYIVRIFNICVPTEHVPWCAPISQIAFLNLIIKAGLVICGSFDIRG